jgi:hypothetical protein
MFTGMRFLAPGSVILFGSTLGGKFVLDTVFIVGTWIDHDARNYKERLKGKVPAAYWEVTLRPWYWMAVDSLSYRLYFGATYDNPVAGMFSFTPCIEVDESSNGFRRPPVELQGVINAGSLQQPRMNPQASPAEAAGLWSAVRQQVLSQDLLLGVHVDPVPWPANSV